MSCKAGSSRRAEILYTLARVPVKNNEIVPAAERRSAAPFPPFLARMRAVERSAFPGLSCTLALLLAPLASANAQAQQRSTGGCALQAIGTARRLGAVVRAYDVRPEAKQEAESVGAKFLALAQVIFARGRTSHARLFPASQRRDIPLHHRARERYRARAFQKRPAIHVATLPVELYSPPKAAPVCHFFRRIAYALRSGSPSG